MNIFDPIISFLQRPFPPTEDWRNRLVIAVLVGLFVTFFLFVFEPFGLSNVQNHKFWICLGFGATTWFASVMFELLMVKGFNLYENIHKFTFGKWVLQVIGLIFTISIANFLFGRWLHGNLEWRFLPQMIYATFAIGVFPTVVLGSLAMLRQERKYQKIATTINSHAISLQNQSTTDSLTINDILVSSIRYVESYQNYIKIGYVDKDDQLQESLHRATLKSLESQLTDTFIIKCHRSFLVNKELVESVSGNAQGLVLALQDCDKKIPVSRSFVSVFR